MIIGINQYQTGRIPNLHGAALDADAMDWYLRTDLHVPAQQIANLRDEAATRDAILRELQALATIRKGDHILIYYAGYGATGQAPEGWPSTDERIPLIVAHDSLVATDDGRYCVHPIPDRTIDALLHKISEQTGSGGGGDVVRSFTARSSLAQTRW